MSKTRTSTLMDRLMAEVIVVGGFALTRHDAARIARAAGFDRRARDWLQAYAPVAAADVQPTTYEAALPYLAPEAAR
jgi:hypothetical protein